MESPGGRDISYGPLQGGGGDVQGAGALCEQCPARTGKIEEKRRVHGKRKKNFLGRKKVLPRASILRGEKGRIKGGTGRTQLLPRVHGFSKHARRGRRKGTVNIQKRKWEKRIKNRSWQNSKQLRGPPSGKIDVGAGQSNKDARKKFQERGLKVYASMEKTGGKVFSK